MKLSDVVNHFLLDSETRGVTPGAIRGYRVQLTLLAQKLEQECQVTELEQVKSVHLRQFVRLLMNTKADENNPRKPTRDRPLSPFTVRNYVRAIKTFFQWCVVSTFLGFRDYVILLALLDTGMRLAELGGLKMVDVHDRYVKVFGKGHKERGIGLHPEVSKLLWKYIHSQKK